MIIAVVSTALVSLGSSTSKQGSYLVNKTIATHLAQEGIELVRNIRDTNTVVRNNPSVNGGNPWDKTINNITSGIINYDSPLGFSNISGNPSDVSDCKKNFGNACRLYLDGHSFYTHDTTGTQTNFYRMISVSTGATVDIITSEVGWTDHGKFYTTKVTTKLYDWQ